MNLTTTEAEALQPVADKAGKAMLEAGANCVLVLWTRQVEGAWRMEWSRHGSPYEAVSLASRYGVIDAQLAQADAIADKLNRPSEDGEQWKEV